VIALSQAGVDPGREILAAAIIGAGFLAVFALAELWKRLRRPPVEWTRKFVHFFGGLIAATFPWVFQSRWTVVPLAGAFLLIIWGTRRLGVLSSVHGVERKSEGGIYYPLAVMVVFLLGHDQPVFYLISILALVVSDTLAALVGSVYGRQAYTVETDRRSLEGSVVFLLTTFLATHLPLLLLAGMEPALSVLIGIQVAIIVTQFEAISLRGNDNLLVPVATFYLLIKMAPHDVDHIATELLAQLVIIAVIGAVAWKTRPLTFSGAIALMLFGYGVWGLGGPEWMVAPGLALVAFIAIRERFRGDAPVPEGRYQVVAVFYVCIVPTLLFLANNTLETLVPGVPPELQRGDPFYAPYVGAVAAQLALIFIAQLAPFRPRVPVAAGRSLAGLAVAIALVVPAGLAVGPRGVTGIGMIAGAGIPVAAAALYFLLRGLGRWPKEARWNLRLQSLSVAAAVAVVVPVQLWMLMR
jgi:dolichol kinase